MKKKSLKESETIELKRSTSELKEAIIAIAAILNKHQKGELYFGVKNDGTVIGQRIGKDTVRDVSKAIADHIDSKIYPKITEKTIERKTCIHVMFTGDGTPYYAYGRAYIRIGDENKLMSAKELERYILEKNKRNIRWDNQICKHATLKDIDTEVLTRFIDLTKKSKRISIKNESKELILKKLNLISENHITNAGILLFGKDPAKFFDTAMVKCGRFKGVEKQEFLDMKDFSGNLFDMVDKSIGFFQEHLRIQAKIKGLLREETWEIPLEALREAVINALIHRDYSDSSFIYIKIYDSQIVIANPGVLPSTLSIKDLYKEHESKLRNPLIARVFYYAGLIDAWGQGILNIINMLQANGLEKPTFEESGGSFRIVFRRVTTNQNELAEKLVERLVESQKKILNLVQQNPHISKKELSLKVGISTTAIDKHIKKLKEMGFLRRIGPDKGGHWEVLKQ